MEQQILLETETKLDVYTNEQPLVSISEPIQTEVVALSIEEDVKVIQEESAVLLVLTEGGSLYKKAVQDGYSGTELEWMTELLDSKASVQFVTTTVADSNSAYALALLALEASVGNTYVSNTHLSEVIATRDLARALDKLNLEVKIESDIFASNQTLLETLVTSEQALSQSINNLDTQLGAFRSRVTTVELSISTETSARALAIQTLNSNLNGRIDSEIVTINQTFVDATGSFATQLNNVNTSFNNLLNSSISEVNTSISNESGARASQINTLRVDFTSGLSSVISTIQQVQIDIDGNTSAIDLVTGQVNNPTTGLNAAFTRANQAYTLADNTAGAFSVIEGKVNHPSTGLAATYSFAQQVLIDANNNTATSINSLRNEITAPNAGWTANNTFIQSINTTAGNALTNAANAQTTANTAITNAGNAQTAANTANTELAAISSDSVLSKGEKPAVVLNVTNILNEQAGITAEGLRYGITTARSNYTTAITNLTSYLSGLTPSYSDVTQNTPIVANTFKDRFADVYAKRQVLLDAIAAAAKVLADNAQTAANNAQGTANNALSIVTTLENNLESTVSGYIANNSLILEIQDDLAGNIQTTSTLSSTVTSLDQWKTNTASVQLTSYGNSIGQLESRAFIGVTSTVNGKATVAGLTVNSVNYSLSFQGNVFELVNTSGVQQLYYNTADGVWSFAGSLVAATFKTALLGYRAEMDGVSAFPFWFGTGTKNAGNGLMYVTTSGDVVLNNATLQGGLVTNSGSGTRGEYRDDGTYLIWLGTGSKTDVNATFYVKKNGTGFIKGDFFTGQIIETKFATDNSAGVNSPAYAVINWTHNSAGKTIEITGSGSTRGRATGGDYSNVILQATGTLYLAGTVIASTVTQVKGVYNLDLNRTEWFINYPLTGISTGHGAGLKSAEYQVIFELIGGSTPNFTYIQKTATVKTFENKLE